MLTTPEKNRLKKSIIKKIKELDKQKLMVERKSDSSPVTQLDIHISEEFKKIVMKENRFLNYSFFSEEDHAALTFPAVILDPLDGTKEYVRGYPECCVSVSFIDHEHKHWSWLFNPFTGFDLTSEMPFVTSARKISKPVLQGLVSRSELEEGLIRAKLNSEVSISALGSIAFKLGILASGGCDFVLSFREKNIWDIAAGTNLCLDRGLSFYSNGKLVEKLVNETYAQPMIWCHPRDFERIQSSIKSF